MEITIKGNPKEIAALVLAVQGHPENIKEDTEEDKVLIKAVTGQYEYMKKHSCQKIQEPKRNRIKGTTFGATGRDHAPEPTFKIPMPTFKK